MQFGLSKTTVMKLLAQHQVPVQRPRIEDDEAAQILELYQGGMRQIDIARKFGRHKGAIWHLLRREGLI